MVGASVHEEDGTAVARVARFDRRGILYSLLYAYRYTGATVLANSTYTGTNHSCTDAVLVMQHVLRTCTIVR